MEKVKNLENKDLVEKPNAEQNKPKTARRIVSIILLAVIALLSFTIILFAFVPKNFDVGLNAPALVEIHTGKSGPAEVYQSTTDEYKKIMELYNESFKTTLLDSMLQGKLFSGPTAKEGYMPESLITGTYLVFTYSEPQKIKINGKDYKANIISDTEYIKVYVEVGNSSNLAEMNAYFAYKATGTNNYSYVRVCSFAKQAKLYEYVNNL